MMAATDSPRQPEFQVGPPRHEDRRPFRRPEATVSGHIAPATDLAELAVAV
jgi:hypothetical protein